MAELREAGGGVRRVLFVHGGTPAVSDQFHSVLTMLDPDVALDIAGILPGEVHPSGDGLAIERDRSLALRIGRQVHVHPVRDPLGSGVATIARQGQYDIIVMPHAEEHLAEARGVLPDWIREVLRCAPCAVFLLSGPQVPQQVDD